MRVWRGREEAGRGRKGHIKRGGTGGKASAGCGLFRDACVVCPKWGILPPHEVREVPLRQGRGRKGQVRGR